MPYIGSQPTTAAFITDTFNGNGSTTAFTMSAAPANTNSILVAVSGVLQDPSTYSVNATTLTFSAAPPSGTGNISVRFLGIPASGVVTTAYRTQTEFTATAGQTTFSVPSYTVGYIDVYRNGVLLGSADFTATNGTTVVLAAGASAGDLIETVSFYVSSVVNAIPAVAGAVNSTYLLDGAVTQSKLGTGVAGNGPAFSATCNSTTTIGTGAIVKLILPVEDFDTASCYNNTGSTVGGIPSYSFLPNVAGYYQVNGSFQIAGTTAGQAIVYKNGSALKGGDYNGVAGTNSVVGVNILVYLNGSTDYIALYGYVDAGTTSNNNPAATWFQAALVRAA